MENVENRQMLKSSRKHCEKCKGCPAEFKIIRFVHPNTLHVLHARNMAKCVQRFQKLLAAIFFKQSVKTMYHFPKAVLFEVLVIGN